MDVIRKKGKPRKIKTKTETIDNPTVKVPEQQVITARNFYNMGMDAEFAYKQPGTPGRDTCQRLWRFWNMELRNSYQMDTNERQILEKQKMIESYKRLIFKLEIQLNKYDTTLDSEFKAWQIMAQEKEANGDENIPSFEINDKLERTKLLVLQAIIDTRDRMGALSIQSTINENDEVEILEHLKKKADRIASADK